MISILHRSAVVLRTQIEFGDAMRFEEAGHGRSLTEPPLSQKT
jgi:hypothetical protein